MLSSVTSKSQYLMATVKFIQLNYTPRSICFQWKTVLLTGAYMCQDTEGQEVHADQLDSTKMWLGMSEIEGGCLGSSARLLC